MIVSETEVAWQGEFVLCLGYAALAVQSLLRNMALDPSIAVGVGFDEGVVHVFREPVQG